MIISHEDNLTGRQPYWKTTLLEDKLAGRRAHRKMTSQEDNLTGRQTHRKMSLAQLSPSLFILYPSILVNRKYLRYIMLANELK